MSTYLPRYINAVLNRLRFGTNTIFFPMNTRNLSPDVFNPHSTFGVVETKNHLSKDDFITESIDGPMYTQNQRKVFVQQDVVPIAEIQYLLNWANSFTGIEVDRILYWDYPSSKCVKSMMLICLQKYTYVDLPVSASANNIKDVSKTVSRSEVKSLCGVLEKIVSQEYFSPKLKRKLVIDAIDNTLEEVLHSEKYQVIS